MIVHRSKGLSVDSYSGLLNLTIFPFFFQLPLKCPFLSTHCTSSPLLPPFHCRLNSQYVNLEMIYQIILTRSIFSIWPGCFGPRMTSQTWCICLEGASVEQDQRPRASTTVDSPRAVDMYLLFYNFTVSLLWKLAST